MINFKDCVSVETCFLLVFLMCLTDSETSLLTFELEISQTISSLCNCQRAALTSLQYKRPVIKIFAYLKWAITYPLHKFDSLLELFSSK